MMALWRPTLWGWRRVAAPHRPARRTAVRAVSTVRERGGVCGGRGEHGGAAAAARHRPLGGSCAEVVAGLATVVWWGVPRLYGGAHAKTAQTDRHGQ